MHSCNWGILRRQIALLEKKYFNKYDSIQVNEKNICRFIDFHLHTVSHV